MAFKTFMAITLRITIRPLNVLSPFPASVGLFDLKHKGESQQHTKKMLGRKIISVATSWLIANCRQLKTPMLVIPQKTHLLEGPKSWKRFTGAGEQWDGGSTKYVMHLLYSSDRWQWPCWSEVRYGDLCLVECQNNRLWSYESCSN